MSWGSSAVVIDSGSGYTKAGFACNQEPMVVIPTIVAWKRKDSHSQSGGAGSFQSGGGGSSGQHSVSGVGLSSNFKATGSSSGHGPGSGGGPGGSLSSSGGGAGGLGIGSRTSGALGFNRHSLESVLIGDGAWKCRLDNRWDYCHPIDGRARIRWIELELFWHELLHKELSCTSSDHDFLLSEPVDNRPTDRETAAEVSESVDNRPTDRETAAEVSGKLFWVENLVVFISLRDQK